VLRVNAEDDAVPNVLRVSMDANATVKIGPFAWGGKGRVAVKAANHDFRAEATVTPVGIFLPQTDELFIYHITTMVASDCLVDRLEQWWDTVCGRFAHITTLVLNLDNGPESHSHRPQFMGRVVAFVQRTGLRVRLAYDPPYHSTYYPVERCWGILEAPWNGALRDSVDAARGFTASMTWKGAYSVVELVTATYQTGVTLTRDAMAVVEAQLVRLFDLDYCLQVKVLSHMSSTRISAARGGKGSVAAYTPYFHEPFAPTHGCRYAMRLMRLCHMAAVRLA